MISAVRHEPIPDLAHLLSRSVASFLPPLVVLAAAHWLGPLFARELPHSLVGLRVWGPAMVLFLAAMLALTFNRGRMLFAALSLAGAYVGWQLQARLGLDAFAARTVYAATCLFVPLNLLALSLLQERGIFTVYGLRRGLALLVQVTLTVWIAASGQTQAVDWLYGAQAAWELPNAPVPAVAMLVMLTGSALTTYRAVRHRSALDAGLTGALLAFALACHGVHHAPAFAMYMGAAGGALAVAVLQDTFRLAFRDELTGLPSRRALNERILTLGTQYTIAMVDVDHFKHVNDVHGHELGDHVLRMIASKLARVGGGGRAYRFGGEEFAIVFPGRRTREAWPHLDALRRRIAAHPLVLRSPARDAAARGHGRAGSDQAPDITVQVTVSIGVAERGGTRTALPEQVLAAADRALYRAKQTGRNRLSL